MSPVMGLFCGFRVGAQWALFFVLGTAFLACGDDDKRARALARDKDGMRLDARSSVPVTIDGGKRSIADSSTPELDAGTERDASAPPSESADSGMRQTSTVADSGADAGDAGPATVNNCGADSCRGHGRCIDAPAGPTCVCDEGYVVEGDADDSECVVDTTCKKIRYLEDDSCRYLFNSVPAVGMFFGVEYCAGTAVLPEDLGDLDEAFEILENGEDIRNTAESVATVIERDVESYVTLALDVSKSVTGVEGDVEKQLLLGRLIAQVREFLHQLENQPDDDSPPVTISIMVFGRFVAEYVPFTTDFNELDRALEQLESDPQSVVALVGGDGTALYQAVEGAIESVERVRSLRSLVTHAGVLTSGTAVIVTDGLDSSNSELNSQLIARTRVNVISVGISGDIDDEYLTKIGRDGSFLAPVPEDWAASFAEIALRVEQYPDRAYMLAYCSSATTGKPTVSVSLRGQAVLETAACTFNADTFSVNPLAECDLNFFDDYCDDAECGSFLACGGCASDSCCVEKTCTSPSTVETGTECYGDDQLCAAAGQVCVANSSDEPSAPATVCADPVESGADCSLSTRCEPGVEYCGLPEGAAAGAIARCLPVIALGEVCGVSASHPAVSCEELNCAKSNPNSATDPYICQAHARIFDACSGAAGTSECEAGSFCKSSICTSRSLRSCNTDRESSSGTCNSDIKHYASTGACYWDWDSVVTPAQP